MRNYLLSREGKQIIVALSFHAYGNLMIHPFNFLQKAYHVINGKNKSIEEIIRLFQGILCPINNSFNFIKAECD